MIPPAERSGGRETLSRVSVLGGGARPVILIDFTGLGPETVFPVIEEARREIRSRPPKSVDTVTKTTGASFNSEVIAALKEWAAGNEPHVHQAAIVGLSGMQRIVLSAVSHFTGRSFLLCDSVEEAQRRLAT